MQRQDDGQELYQAIGIIPEELRAGDIILETDFRDKPDVIHKAIRVGQFMQSAFFKLGHRQSVHAAIIVQANDVQGRPLKIVEVVGKGILSHDINYLKKCTYYVLRSKNEKFALETARIAYFMYKYLRDHPAPEKPAVLKADEIVLSAPSGFKHVVKGSKNSKIDPDDFVLSAPSGFRHVASGAAALEEVPFVSRPTGFAQRGHEHRVKYSQSDAALSVLISYELLFSKVFSTDNMVSTDTFCSKFVIECMQLAQNHLKMGQYVHLEKRSSPRSLEDYLKRHDDFTWHVIAKNNEKVSGLILEILIEEIEKQKAASNPVVRKAGEFAEGLLRDLSSRLGLTACSLDSMQDVSDFDRIAVLLSRVLPVLKWPEAVRSQLQVYGLGLHLLNSERVANLAERLFIPQMNYN